jgi:hypothetical protein
MRLKKHITHVLSGMLVLCLGVLTYLLLWGKLFPFSPVILGFAKHELAHTVVYVQQGAGVEDYATIDSFIPVVEQFHELKFVRKPKIFIFRDRTSYLQRSISTARFCAFPSGVVISPWALQEAKAGTISLEIYLKHELSHTLLDQQMSLLRAYQYPPWLMEGIAVYSTQQMGTSWYPSKAATYALIRQGNFMPPAYFKTRQEDQIQLAVPYRNTFMYAEFACLVDYLITMRGKATFLQYMQNLFKDSHHDQVFQAVYGLDFETFLKNFQELVRITPP